MIELRLKTLLEQGFEPEYLNIENQSELHHGHLSSPETGESHFKITIVSEKFDGMPRLQRHQAVNTFVSSLFDEGLHALSLTLLSPGEYDKK